MANRTFGVIQGAGSRVNLLGAAQPPVVDGPFGTTALVGWFQSGPLDRTVNVGSDEGLFRRIYGGRSQLGFAPEVALQWLMFARGAGQLLCQRIDNTEAETARLEALRDRSPDPVFGWNDPKTVRGQAWDIEADNPGRWAGARDTYAGADTFPAAVSAPSSITLSALTTAGRNEGYWRDATLAFPNLTGSPSYRVDTDDGSGNLTIVGAFGDAVLNASGTVEWLLVLTSEDPVTEESRRLALEVRDGDEDNTLGFTFVPYRDNVALPAYENLVLDPTKGGYYVSRINEQVDNYELEVSALTTPDPNDPAKRPANWCGILKPGYDGSNTLEFATLAWDRTSPGSGTAFVDAEAFIYPSEDMRTIGAIRCTFTAATTYDVALVLSNGQTVAVGSGTLGTLFQSTTYGWITPSIMLRAGSAPMSSGDVITIYLDKLDLEAIEQPAPMWCYPHAVPASGDTRIRFKVLRVIDHESIELAADEDAITASGLQSPGVPSLTSGNAGPYDMSAGSLTFIFTIAGQGPFTLTSTLSGAAETATAVAADFQALEDTRAGGSALALLEFDTNSSDEITVTAKHHAGPISLVLGNGTVNTELGFTNGQTATGAQGSVVRLQWPQQFQDGGDGDLVSDSDVALPYTDGRLDQIVPDNTGHLVIANPGFPNASSANVAQAWADENGMHFQAEIPSTITTEAGAVAWDEANLQVGDLADSTVRHFPSYGDVVDPDTGLLKTVPITGCILGLMARYAQDNEGFQDAPAGPELEMGSYVRNLTTDGRRLNNEVLNGYGINEVRQRASSIYLWGDRIAGRTTRPFLHKQRAILHIARVLRTNTDNLVFKRNNDEGRAAARRSIRNLFRPWFNAGWFDDANGADFDSQVQITCDLTNNPKTERDAGRLNIAIATAIVNTSEQVVFTLSGDGVTVSS